MAIAYRVSCPDSRIKGSVSLESSKSISNRALIIRSLCDQPFVIHRLSTSDDTRALMSMLTSNSDSLNSGHAGSSYRFMLARACLFDHEVILDASPQMRKRPIGPLVKALQNLGAAIEYLQKDGFPPVKIKPSPDFGRKGNEVSLQSGISSQYITALLLIAPYLPDGLTIHMNEPPVSESYVQMTLDMIGHFGIPCEQKELSIRVPPGKYIAKDFVVEGDWSAASYYYSIAALANQAELHIHGLLQNSLQGDSVVVALYKQLGVETTFTEDGISLKKFPVEKPKELLFHFGSCPDIAQTVMVTLAGMGITGKLSGLKTLRIKETDRITAMQNELTKVKISMEATEADNDITCKLYGRARWKDKAKFDTYQDHRMAMSFTPLACIHPIIIRDPEVVNKSYPGFWRDLKGIGMITEKIKG